MGRRDAKDEGRHSGRAEARHRQPRDPLFAGVATLLLLVLMLPLVLGAVDEAADAESQAEGAPPQEDAVRSLAYDYSLSTTEAAKRLRDQPHISTLLQEARRAFPATFAGLYVDHSSGPEVRLKFTEEPQAAVDNLQERFPQLELVAEHAASSERELEAVISRASSIRSSASSRVPSLGAVDLAVDIPNNAIRVSLDGGTAASKTIISDLVGHRTIFEAGAAAPECTRLDCYYMMGGLRVTGPSGCSTGFNIMFYESGNAVSRGVLTAGHCGNVGSQWSHGGDYLGAMTHSQLSGNLDAAVIDFTTTAGIVDPPFIFDEVYDDPTEEALTVADMMYYYEFYAGQQVCKSGVSTLVTCGIVENTSVSVSYIPGSTDIVRTDYCAVAGDSGSAVWDPSYGEARIRAAGIHSGGYSGSCSYSGNYSLFTPVDFAASAFGFQVTTKWNQGDL